MVASCLADRLSRYLPLTDRERRALAGLEDVERTVRRGTVVRRERDRTGDFAIVRAGWACSYTLLDDGSRQIIRLYLPGDIAGLAALALTAAAESMVALTDLTLCPFDRAAVRGLFDDHPRLAALIFSLEQIERTAIADRLASIGRSTARSRIAGLIMDTLARLRAVTPDAGQRFVFPMTQEEIGDATGLTAVHVNRMMRVLTEDRLIARGPGWIEVIDEARLVRTANHVDRYARIETGWLPASR